MLINVDSFICFSAPHMPHVRIKRKLYYLGHNNDICSYIYKNKYQINFVDLHTFKNYFYSCAIVKYIVRLSQHSSFSALIQSSQKHDGTCKTRM